MAETTMLQAAAGTTSRWAFIKEMFAEMDQLHARMKQDREDIERLAAHTRTNLVEIKPALDRMAAS